MKTRLVIIAILLLILTVLLSRNNEHISDTLLSIINPLKQSYKNFTQDIEEKSYSLIFQKETIEKLQHENQILRKRLLEQIHYIQEVKSIYDVLPELTHLPLPSIAITETISYVKLNSFSKIILTKPKGLQEEALYGLIQNRVVGGIARVQSNQLYGYLTSDSKCRFSVFIGEKQASGIAIGLSPNRMIVKFIPKWHNIAVGDKVVTSGLDGIFFPDIPVGIVTAVEVQSSYTVAYIKTYSDIFHPKTFFLIKDAKASLTQGFEGKNIQLRKHYSVPQIICKEENTTEENLTEKVCKIEGNITIENEETSPERLPDEQAAETLSPKPQTPKSTGALFQQISIDPPPPASKKHPETPYTPEVEAIQQTPIDVIEPQENLEPDIAPEVQRKVQKIKEDETALDLF